jgi:hypothetical protein
MTPAQQVTLSADSLVGEAVVVLYFSDQKPLQGPAALLDWRLDGQLTRMLIDKAIEGRAGEHVMLQGNGKFAAEWVLFVGGGKWHGLCCETHAALVKHMLQVAQQAGFKDVALAFMPHEEVGQEILMQQINDALAIEGSTNEAAKIERCCFSCEEPVAS